jgi:cytochrome c biogenesis protein CcdA
MKKISSGKLISLVIVAIALFGFVLFMRGSGFGTTLLWNISDGGKWLLPLVVVSSLIDSINPCAFSVLLITIAFLAQAGARRGGILRMGGAYIAGIFTVYLFIGLGILKVLHFFNTPHFMAKVGAALLIIVGLIDVLGRFFPSFPIKFRIPKAAHGAMAGLMGKASFGAAFLLGVLVGMCEFPCTGGPYLMVLGLLHDSGTYWSGFSYLLLYNAVFVLPLAIILFIASDRALLGRVQAWKKDETSAMRLWGGVAMILLGVLIFFL